MSVNLRWSLTPFSRQNKPQHKFSITKINLPSIFKGENNLNFPAVHPRYRTGTFANKTEMFANSLTASLGSSQRKHNAKFLSFFRISNVMGHVIETSHNVLTHMIRNIYKKIYMKRTQFVKISYDLCWTNRPGDRVAHTSKLDLEQNFDWSIEEWLWQIKAARVVDSQFWNQPETAGWCS